jgi:hypothetical protein
MWHVWPALGELVPESRIAFDEIKEFLDGAKKHI